MSAGERTGYRSLVYSGWHRPASIRRFVGALGAAALAMIDIDACEYCARCMTPVALIETARTLSPPKSARVTARLSTMAGIPAFSVSYSGAIVRDCCAHCGRIQETGDIDRFLVQRIQPRHSEVVDMNPHAYAAFLMRLRRGHECAA